MGFLGDLFSEKNYILWVEAMTILSVIVLICYCFYSLGLFKKN